MLVRLQVGLHSGNEQTPFRHETPFYCKTVVDARNVAPRI